MARLPRVVITDVAHHVTQRGNARQVILGDDADRIRGIGTALAELVGVSGSVD